MIEKKSMQPKKDSLNIALPDGTQEKFDGTAKTYFCKAMYALSYYPQLATLCEEDVQVAAEQPDKGYPTSMQDLAGIRGSTMAKNNLGFLGWAAFTRDIDSFGIRRKMRKITPEGAVWYGKAKEWIDGFYEGVGTDTEVQLPEDFPTQIHPDRSSNTLDTSRLQFLWVIMHKKKVSTKDLATINIFEVGELCRIFRNFVTRTGNDIELSEKGIAVTNHLLLPIWEEAKAQSSHMLTLRGLYL